MTLDGFTDTNLTQLIRYVEDKITRRLVQMETAVSKGEFQKATQVTGNLEELRHIIATAEGVLRARKAGGNRA